MVKNIISLELQKISPGKNKHCIKRIKFLISRAHPIVRASMQRMGSRTEEAGSHENKATNYGHLRSIVGKQYFLKKLKAKKLNFKLAL